MQTQATTSSLEPLLDVPAKEGDVIDETMFKVHAANLANVLTRGGRTPMTMGIFGGYGSGKTTLMRLIEEGVKQKSGVVTVWFNAWRYDHEEHLFLPFLATLATHEALKTKSPEAPAKAYDAFNAFLSGLTLKLPWASWFIGESLKKEQENADARRPALKRLTSGYQDIAKLLEELASPSDEKAPKLTIIVFVDDLDRCIPIKAFNLLEAFKAFTDVVGFRYVLGLDPRAIDTYIEEKYPESFCVTPSEYLQKMVQIPFHLPELDSDHALAACRKLLSDRSKKEVWARQVLKIADDLKEWLPATLRQLKRMLNMHQLVVASHGDGKLVPELLWKLLIVQTRWPDAYGKLHRSLPAYRATLKAPEALQKRIEAMGEVIKKMDALIDEAKKTSLPADCAEALQKSHEGLLTQVKTPVLAENQPWDQQEREFRGFYAQHLDECPDNQIALHLHMLGAPL